MRIGIDCRMYSSSFTGIGRYVQELTDQLFRIDQRNEYVLFFNEPEFSVFQPPNHRVKKVLAQAPHYSYAEQIGFLQILNNQKLDLMHFTHFNAPILYSYPSIVTIHDLTLHFYPGKKMTSLFKRIAYVATIRNVVKKSRHIITVSENTKKDLKEFLHTPDDKISVIYGGVDAKFTSRPVQAELKVMKEKYGLDKPYLLYTGVWRSHKNIPNLVRAFAILKKQHGYEGLLVITGKHDPLYAPEIFALIHDFGLEKFVITPGLVPEKELPLFYAGALAYVFPSLYEGFGLPPLEAMQCSLPVIASRTSCIPEVCGQDNAVYFDPLNPEDMAAKIFRVISDETLRALLIERGLAHVRTFSWQRMAEEHLKIYQTN